MSEETKEYTSTQNQSSNKVPKHLSCSIQNPMIKRANGRNSYISKNTIKPNKNSEFTKESAKNTEIINSNKSIDEYFNSKIKILKQNFRNKAINEDRENLSLGLKNNTNNENKDIMLELAKRNDREGKEKIIRAIIVIKEDKKFLNFCKNNREINEEARKICEITTRYEKFKKDIGQEQVNETNLKKMPEDQLNYLSQAISGIDSKIINQLVENSYKNFIN